MNYVECIEQARGRIGNYCKACVECNGRACRNQMPGPGAKGIGDTAMRNYDKWKEIRVQMDTIVSMTFPIMIFWYRPVRNAELQLLPGMVQTVMSWWQLQRQLPKNRDLESQR